LCLLLVSMSMPAEAARELVGDRAKELTPRRLLRRATVLLEAGENERGVKMLQTIIQQHPTAHTRFETYLVLGRHLLKEQEHEEAIEVLRNMNRLKKVDEEFKGEDKDMYLEGLYLTGVCHFHMRNYSSAFSTLRQITTRHPNTVWANQAYYYIGLSHFAQSHWSKAIKALSLVGTFIDPESPEVQFVEAGRRFYIKLEDLDLPILHRQDKEIVVKLTSDSGDQETVTCVPLAGKSAIFLGSIATQLDERQPNDKVLQIIGGDKLSATYFDDNTMDGDKNVAREKEVHVVSSAAVTFTLATYEGKTTSAFMGQPAYVKLRDADLDITRHRDSARIKIITRYKAEELGDVEPSADEDEEASDIADYLSKGDEIKFVTRDELIVDLTETTNHSGVFVGNVMIERLGDADKGDVSDRVLSCQLGDDLIATYLDERHIRGDVPEEISAMSRVYGEIDTSPTISQNVVGDAFIKAKKDLVESEAYLELARIFKSMGLREGAEGKAEAGLERVEYTLTAAELEGSPLKQQAFRLKWDLYLAQDDLVRAMATCKIFNELYPDSPLVDQALMGIGKVFMERGEDEEAIRVFGQVLALPNAFSRPEAQFRIAEILETRAIALAAESQEPPEKESAIQAYKLCARRYPESPYAGRSLGKVIDHHIESKEYVIADDLLEQVFLDYQDEPFLDSMLLKWVLVSYRMGNLQKAHDKCQELVIEHPGSEYAKKAQVILEKIESRLGKKPSSAESEGA
jgi:TolA-binding protein